MLKIQKTGQAKQGSEFDTMALLCLQ